MLKDQRDLLLAFNEHRVKYLLVGGYALVQYTEPRVTKDMDVWVDITTENAERVFKALALFGAPLAGYTPQDFQDPYSGFQIGQPPYEIDILFAVSALSFDEAWTESTEGFTDEGIPVRYLSSDHFIRNKTAVGRLQDLADVAAVLASRKANSTSDA
jgi:hypothetical protein